MDTTKESSFATPGGNIVDPNKVNEIDYESKKRRKGVEKVKKSIRESIDNKFPNMEKLHEKFGTDTKKSLFDMIISEKERGKYKFYITI